MTAVARFGNAPRVDSEEATAADAAERLKARLASAYQRSDAAAVAKEAKPTATKPTTPAARSDAPDQAQARMQVRIEDAWRKPSPKLG